MNDRQSLRARNLDAIAGMVPEIGESLRAYEPASPLIFDDDGQPDVLAGGSLVYNGRYHRHVSEQMEIFRASQRRFEQHRRDAGEYDDEHVNRFLGKFQTGAKARGFGFAENSVRDESYFLTIFGIGLGGQIDELVETTKCQTIIIAEAGLEFIYHSLETYDWHALIAQLEARGGSIMFAFGATPPELSSRVALAMRITNPSSLDGTTVYCDRTSSFHTDAVTRFTQKDCEIAVEGLGFVNDETLMLKNAYLNLRAGDTKVFCRTDERIVDVPVFIVASGPSIDTSLPHIKANAEKAIIVSCGTGLSPLLANGITPDFHFELENIGIDPVLANVSKDHDLSAINFVAAMSVEHGVSAYFAETIHYFRPGICAYPLFCDSERFAFRAAFPNVADAAFSFAQDLGARSVYLFGIDLGVRQAGGQHHSKDSYYYTDNAIFVPADLVYTVPVDGNFGGTILASSHLDRTRRQLEFAVSNFGAGSRYFNCSDGALIEGMQPQLADAISLPGIEGGKAEYVKKLIDGFPIYQKDKFDEMWDRDALEHAFRGLAGDINDAIDGLNTGDGKVALGTLARMMHLNDYLAPIDVERLRYTAVLFLRGSILKIMSTAEYFMNRLADPNQFDEASAYVREELHGAVGRILDIAITTLNEPTVVPTSPADGSAGSDILIPEVSYTWGKVALNADCPCGSGKRYKNCHGKNAPETA